MESDDGGLVKFCSIEFTDNPACTLRVVACVRMQPLGAVDPQSTAKLDGLTLAGLCRCVLATVTLHVAIFRGMTPYRFVHRKNKLLPYPSQAIKPTRCSVYCPHTVCVLTTVLILFCPNTVCAHSSPNYVLPLYSVCSQQSK